MSKNKNFSDTAASRYSLALYELAEEEKDIKKIEEQASALLNLIIKSKNFESIIRNPTNKKEEQIKIINILSANYNFTNLLKNFLCFLVEKRRLFFYKIF